MCVKNLTGGTITFQDKGGTIRGWSKNNQMAQILEVLYNQRPRIVNGLFGCSFIPCDRRSVIAVCCCYQQNDAFQQHGRSTHIWKVWPYGMWWWWYFLRIPKSNIVKPAESVKKFYESCCRYTSWRVPRHLYAVLTPRTEHQHHQHVFGLKARERFKEPRPQPPLLQAPPMEVGF